MLIKNVNNLYLGSLWFKGFFFFSFQQKQNLAHVLNFPLSAWGENKSSKTNPLKSLPKEFLEKTIAAPTKKNWHR